jgi:hypothetical protein
MSGKLPTKDFFETIMRRVRSIPFSYVIEMTTGHKVIPLSEEDKEVIDEIFEAACAILKEVKEEDYSELRPNEISNRLEDKLRSKLEGVIPENKVAGYPNIMIERGGKVYYVEVKLAEVEQLNSSFRTFYYEPVEFAKVTRDARHVLVGFLHKAKSVIGFKIVDLSKINVNLKSEFNANNKELYKREAVIKSYPEEHPEEQLSLV